MSRLKSILTYPVRVDADSIRYKKATRNGLIACLAYSLIYGLYEYFVVYHYASILHTTALTEWLNWIIMIGGVVIVVSIATRFKFEQVVMGLLLMLLVEDLTYWLSQWVDTGTYPFPVSDWWGSFYPSFHVLGLGSPVPFWPHVPTHYIFGMPIVVLYYCLAIFKGPRGGRCVFWVIGPFFLAILGGAVVSDDSSAVVVLIVIPIVVYLYSGLTWLGIRAKHSYNINN